MTTNFRRELHFPHAYFPEEYKNYLMKYARVTALGYMSSAITHEIGNALTVISGNAQIIQLKDLDQTVEQILTRNEAVIDQISRTQQAINRVGSFGSRIRGKTYNFPPKKQVNNSIFAFQRSCALAGIKLSTEISDGGEDVYFDPSLLEFILLEFLYLYLNEPAEGSDLLINAWMENDQFVVKSELKLHEDQVSFPIYWENEERIIDLVGSLLVLEKFNCSAYLFIEGNTAGWEIFIPLKQESNHDD